MYFLFVILPSFISIPPSSHPQAQRAASLAARSLYLSPEVEHLQRRALERHAASEARRLAASRLQRAARGLLGRRSALELRAALGVVQRALRRCLRRVRIRRATAAKDGATRCIQRWVRGRQARAHLVRLVEKLPKLQALLRAAALRRRHGGLLQRKRDEAAALAASDRDREARMVGGKPLQRHWFLRALGL